MVIDSQVQTKQMTLYLGWYKENENSNNDAKEFIIIIIKIKAQVKICKILE